MILNFFENFFRLIVGLIFPALSNKYVNNCSNDIDDTPSIEIFWTHLTPTQLVLICIAGILAIGVFSVGVFQFYYVYNYCSSGKRRTKLYYLASLLPVSTSMCLIAMYCPRATLIASSLGILYFLLCLFTMVSLIRHLSKGRTTLANDLQTDSKLICYRSPPLCCCLFCLPQSRPTIQNLKRLEYMVLQAPIVRTIIVLGQIIATAEAREHALKWLQIFEYASILSIMLAIFGMHTLARLISGRLQEYGFNQIFRIIDVALMLFTTQHPLIFQNIFVRFGVIHCATTLSSQDYARFICNFVIIVELALLCLLSTFLISPDRNKLFDLYHYRRVSSASMCPSNSNDSANCGNNVEVFNQPSQPTVTNQACNSNNL